VGPRGREDEEDDDDDDERAEEEEDPPRDADSSGDGSSPPPPDYVGGNYEDRGSSPPSSSPSSSRLPSAFQSILEQTCHCDVLGITRSASLVEIRKAYRRRCVLTHPDKAPGGDRTAFDKVSEAYDVLGSEE
jgi:DnaJ-domain-containing protein 1